MPRPPCAPEEAEKHPLFWNQQASKAIQAALALQPKHYLAKNLILFLGDGECPPGPTERVQVWLCLQSPIAQSWAISPRAPSGQSQCPKSP